MLMNYHDLLKLEEILMLPGVNVHTHVLLLDEKKMKKNDDNYLLKVTIR